MTPWLGSVLPALRDRIRPVAEPALAAALLRSGPWVRQPRLRPQRLMAEASCLCFARPRPKPANLLAVVVVASPRLRLRMQLPAHWRALVLQVLRPQLALGARHLSGTLILGQILLRSPPWRMPAGSQGLHAAALRRRLPPWPWPEPVPADCCLPPTPPLGGTAPRQLHLTGCLRLALVTVRMRQ